MQNAVNIVSTSDTTEGISRAKEMYSKTPAEDKPAPAVEKTADKTEASGTSKTTDQDVAHPVDDDSDPDSGETGEVAENKAAEGTKKKADSKRESTSS